MNKKLKTLNQIIIIDGKANFSTMISLSENIRYEEDEGYLYCDNVIMGRTGTQEYLGRELRGLIDDEDLEADKIYQLHRLEDDVFHEDTLKSAKGKSVTYKHPRASKVTADNYQLYEVGTILDVWRDGDNIVGNIVIKDKQTISAILHDGVRELSLGYRAKVVKDGDKYYQKEIYINHLAVVEQGRAGNAQIVDHKQGEVNEVMGKENKGFFNWLSSLFVRKKDDGELSIVDSEEKVISDQEMLDAVYKTVSQFSATSIETYDDETGESTEERITHEARKRTIEEGGSLPNAVVGDEEKEKDLKDKDKEKNADDDKDKNTKDKENNDKDDKKSKEKNKEKGVVKDMEFTLQKALEELKELQLLQDSEFKDNALADLDKRAVEAGFGSIVPRKPEKTINDTMGLTNNEINPPETPKAKVFDYGREVKELQRFYDGYNPSKHGFSAEKLVEHNNKVTSYTLRDIAEGGIK